MWLKLGNRVTVFMRSTTSSAQENIKTQNASFFLQSLRKQNFWISDDISFSCLNMLQKPLCFLSCSFSSTSWVRLLTWISGSKMMDDWMDALFMVFIVPVNGLENNNHSCKHKKQMWATHPCMFKNLKWHELWPVVFQRWWKDFLKHIICATFN